MGQFKYIICLDVEATCWGEYEPDYNAKEKSEIIELGAVLLHLESGSIVSEFHEYIRPVVHPMLSDFCINLTGITQSFVDQQLTFPFVYGKFIKWLCDIQTTHGLRFATPTLRNTQYGGINVAFCSWTNWDFNAYIKFDCNRHQITPQPLLKAWIDARKIFNEKYPGKYSFAEALQHINIAHAGTAHSGIDDAKTLAKMVFVLYASGARFNRVTTWYQ